MNQTVINSPFPGNGLAGVKTLVKASVTRAAAVFLKQHWSPCAGSKKIIKNDVHSEGPVARGYPRHALLRRPRTEPLLLRELFDRSEMTTGRCPAHKMYHDKWRVTVFTWGSREGGSELPGKGEQTCGYTGERRC